MLPWNNEKIIKDTGIEEKVVPLCTENTVLKGIVLFCPIKFKYLYCVVKKGSSIEIRTQDVSPIGIYGFKNYFEGVEKPDGTYLFSDLGKPLYYLDGKKSLCTFTLYPPPQLVYGDKILILTSESLYLFKVVVESVIWRFAVNNIMYAVESYGDAPITMGGTNLLMQMELGTPPTIATARLIDMTENLRRINKQLIKYDFAMKNININVKKYSEELGKETNETGLQKYSFIKLSDLVSNTFVSDMSTKYYLGIDSFKDVFGNLVEMHTINYIIFLPEKNTIWIFFKNKIKKTISDLIIDAVEEYSGINTVIPESMLEGE